MAKQVLRIIVFMLLCSIALQDKSEKSEEQKAKEEEEKDKEEERRAAEKFKKKDPRDYTDADLERLADQWDKDEEPLPDDELPEWKRKNQPKIDLSQLDPKNPEKLVRKSKKGKTLMMFAQVSGNPSKKETEDITKIWQTSLFNMHFDVQRYIIEDNKVLFMLNDGERGWDVKDFLVTQERCESVTIESKDYIGKGSPKFGQPEEKKDEL